MRLRLAHDVAEHLQTTLQKSALLASSELSVDAQQQDNHQYHEPVGDAQQQVGQHHPNPAVDNSTTASIGAVVSYTNTPIDMVPIIRGPKTRN